MKLFLIVKVEGSPFASRLTNLFSLVVEEGARKIEKVKFWANPGTVGVLHNFIL